MKTILHKTSSTLAVAFIALSCLSSGSLKAMIHDYEEVQDATQLQGKFLIKNAKHKEYLYTSNYIINDDPIIQGNEGISQRSIFTFKKRAEGWLIKSESNGHIGKYLYAADSDRIGGDRAVEYSDDTRPRSFFNIFKTHQGSYVLRSDKHKEYVLLSDSTTRNEDRVVKTWSKLADNSYFNFCKLSPELENLLKN